MSAITEQYFFTWFALYTLDKVPVSVMVLTQAESSHLLPVVKRLCVVAVTQMSGVI